MKFKIIKLSELENFLNSDIYKNNDIIPISKQRAISQIQNPRASSDDVVLIVAIDKENKIIGYIGALPDKIYHNPNLKVCWNSCWWVDSKKGKRISMLLFYKLLETWNSNIMFRDLTERTKKILLKTNRFVKIKNIDNFKLFLKFNFTDILPRKFSLFRHYTYLLKFIDYLLNLNINIYHFFYLKKTKKKSIKSVYINNIDKEAEKFINLHNKTEIIRRGKAELDWFIKYPWLTENYNNKNIQQQKKYYFSLLKKQFKNHLIKLYSKTLDSEKLIGVVFATEVNKEIKIPYIYFSSENVKEITNFLITFLISRKSKSFFTANKEISEIFSSKKLFFLYKKLIKKEFIVSKNLENEINKEHKLQDGESDFVFT